MSCHKCSNKAVIDLQHGTLCKSHFISYFEQKVFKTIGKHQLLGRNEKICVAVSGGKDSLTALYLIKKYVKKNNIGSEVIALAVDEGIADYREKTIEDLKEFCNEHEVALTIVSNKDEFNFTLDDAYPIINKGTKKKPCHVCGVWRRYLLNKYAHKLKADKVVTGHNLDDEAQVIMMNILKANTKLAVRLGPKTGVKEHDYFVQRVKPLYFCTEKEVRLYTLLKGFKIQYTECPYSKEGFRFDIQKMLNDMELKYRGTKQSVVKSFLSLLPQMNQENIEIGKCNECGEAANRDVCNACEMKMIANNNN